LVCVLVGVSAEAAFQYFIKKEIKVMNGSAVITGLLVGMNVPPHVPVWMPAIGTIFAVIIVKELFGGLGHNIFNPALAGKAFMAASWPVYMTTTIDGRDGNLAFAVENNILKPLFIGNTGGCIGEASVLFIFIGGLILIFRRIIRWHIPVAFIGTVAVISYLYYYILGFTHPEFAAIFHIFSGSVFLGAFFMATDLVTSPVSGIGMIIFGIGCGLLTFTIKVFGGYPEGVVFSILIMNAVVPLIDRFVKPGVFGIPK
jgi:electron transport complex protein RnfD